MSLGDEVGVHPSTLSRWLIEAATVRSMAKRKTRKQTAEKQDGMKRPQDWRPEEKLQAVLEAASLSEEELGEFLRRRGLHQAQLDEWRELVTKAALDNLGGSRRSRRTSPEAKRIRELEKELHRKDKALAETAALLVLKKKVDAIWGDVDDDTDPKNGR